MAKRYGAIEAGGTKFVCAVGAGHEAIDDLIRIPTADPEVTLGAVVEFLGGHEVAGIGIASFGPVELRRGHPRYGHITATPKVAWRDVDVVGSLAHIAPVGFDTDVNGAAIGEARFGAGRGFDSIIYMTVGTGVGAALAIDGRPAHGRLVHPEMGHVGVDRMPGDEFPGSCPFHGDCLEGMVAGPALAARFGVGAETLTPTDAEHAADLVAAYLASGLRSIVYATAPRRIVIGGGVTRLPGVMTRVHAALQRELAGYPGLPEHADPGFVTAPGLGDMAGIAGAFVLAAEADSGLDRP